MWFFLKHFRGVGKRDIYCLLAHLRCGGGGRGENGNALSCYHTHTHIHTQGEAPHPLLESRKRIQKKYLDQIEELYEDFHVVRMPLMTNEVRGVPMLTTYGTYLMKVCLQLSCFTCLLRLSLPPRTMS